MQAASRRRPRCHPKESKLRLVIVPAALAALALGACGGGSNSAGGTTTAAGGTTSTSEAESPVGDAGENSEFCAQYIEQMQSVQSSAQDLGAAGSAMAQAATDPAAAQQAVSDMQAAAAPMSTAFTELATDAPTEIQPQFETIATGFNTLADGDLKAIQGATADIAFAKAKVDQFIIEHCKDSDMSAIQDTLWGSSSNSGTATP